MRIASRKVFVRRLHRIWLTLAMGTARLWSREYILFPCELNAEQKVMVLAQSEKGEKSIAARRRPGWLQLSVW